MMRSLVLVFLFMVVLAPLQARADVSVSSPVHGYCRIGRYTPVEITHDGASDLLIEADGMLPLHLRAGAGGTAVVPVLAVSYPDGTVNIRSPGSTRSATLPWRVLLDDERLVGVIGYASSVDGQFLFPDKRIIPVQLDPSCPLPGTLAAWEVLDAIVCDAGAMPGVDDASLPMLLGCGVVLTVRSPRAPDDRWPWQHRGEWWVLQYEPVGPRTALSQSAYAPVRTWSPGASVYARATLLGLGGLIVIGALAALTQRRSRAGVLGGLGVLGAASVGIVVVWSRLPAQHEAQGTVAVFGGGLLQHDLWAYLSPAGLGSAVTCPCFPLTAQPQSRLVHIAVRPLLTSSEQASRQKLTMEVDAAGEPQRWTACLPRGEKLAFLARVVDPWASEPEPYSTATDSPLQSLVQEAYMTAGLRVMGQGHPRTDRVYGFAEVFLQRDR